jgi:class 3 adenylate cyclase
MATLDAKTRASLPNSAFAYVDSKGQRRLPIHDEAHVRNALARFNQVKFENEEARDRSFRKLLRAAASYGIAPVGFVAARLREAGSPLPRNLPAGQVTLLMTDIEGSTGLVASMGDDYPPLLEGIRTLVRNEIERAAGIEVDSKADEMFAAFRSAIAALESAVSIQRALTDGPFRMSARLRIGLHSGSPARTDSGYVGMPVHTVARICFAGHGGQILVSGTTRDELAAEALEGVELASLGHHEFHGLPEPVEVFQAQAPGLPEAFPPLRVGK